MHLIVRLIFRRIYRGFLSPVVSAFGLLTVGPTAGCRFEESCSRFSERMIEEKGWLRGIGQSLLRIAKCNGFYKGDLSAK